MTIKTARMQRMVSVVCNGCAKNVVWWASKIAANHVYLLEV